MNIINHIITSIKYRILSFLFHRAMKRFYVNSAKNLLESMKG